MTGLWASSSATTLPRGLLTTSPVSWSPGWLSRVSAANHAERGELEARALTPEECREWLAILDSSELARPKDLPDFTRFLLGTVCRLGEGVGVRWEDLDVERHLLQVRRTVLRV